MSSLFSCSGVPGKIIATSSATAAPMAMTIDAQFRIPGSGTVFETDGLTTLGLCTNLDLQQSVSAQFQNTFNNTIYVTPFGDLPGTAAVSFIINPSCASPTGLSGTVINDYFTYRLQPSYYNGATLVRSPNIWLSIGAERPITLYGYLIGLNLRGSSSQSIMIQGTLFMKVWKY